MMVRGKWLVAGLMMAVAMPLGGGLMYVQPIYTQTTATTGSYPALRFVVVRFGEHLGIGETLQEALDKVFEGDAGADTGEGTIPEGVEPSPVDPGEPETPVDAKEKVRDLLDEAEGLFTGADEALKAGDLGAYQTKMKAAEAKIAEAAKVLDGE